MESFDSPPNIFPAVQEKVTLDIKETEQFATICSFLQYFGPDLEIFLSFSKLDDFLSEASASASNYGIAIHVKLLNKLKLRASYERWEPYLGRFLLNYASNIPHLVDVGNILTRSTACKAESGVANNLNNGRSLLATYFNLTPIQRLNTFIFLLEQQFERNQSFKEKVNFRSAVDLRPRPLGYDVWGRAYLLMTDEEINLLIYREDFEEETIKLICQSIEDMAKLLEELRDVCPEDKSLSNVLTSKASDATNDKSLQHLAESDIREKVRRVCKSSLIDIIPPIQSGTESFIKQDHSVIIGVDHLNPLLKTEIKIDEHNCRSDEPILKANVCVTTSVEGVLPTEPSEITSVKRENGHSLKETIDGEKHDTPSIDNPKLDDSIKEEHDFDLKKDRKRKGKRYEPTNVEQDLNFTPRRSGRQRKQVEFLTMEPIKPKSYSRSTIINEEECDKSRGKKRKASDEYGDDDNGEASLKEGKVKRRRKSLRDSEGKIKKKKKKRKIKKSGKVSGSAPWMRGTSSESSTSEEEDYFERVLLAIHDSDDEDPKPKHKIGKNDFEWNNQPESDFDPEGLDKESDVDSITQGRNLARQKRRQKGVKKKRMGSVEDEEELEEDKPCQICSRSHLPEWILLCDRCDLGHHAMCLFPPLFIIPEGEWFCPRCQHSALINSIANKITELQAERKAREHKQRMQERINFISISLTNILPSEQRAAKHKTRLYGSGNGSINGLDESTSDESRTISDRSSTVADSEGTTRKCRLRHRHENDSCDNDINETNSTSNDSSFSRIRRRARRTARSRAGSRLTTRQTRFNSCEDTGSGTETSNSLEALPLMRATRRRSIRYDINDAFKQIDEALEGDEKYQSQKRRRERRKERRSQGLPTDDSSEEEEEDDDGDVELGTTEGGKDGRRTGGRSRGKDLSNILGPDWKDDDAERRRRRRRLGDSLSQSSESEAAFGGRKGSDGNQTMDKRARPRKGSDGDDDDDFQPSEASNSSSRTQDDESAGSIEEEFSSGSIASDDSWRHELSSKKRSGRKPSWRHRNNKYSMSSFNKKRFQKFDGSDIDAEAGRNSRILPSRRATRRVVSYQESEDDSETVKDHGGTPSIESSKKLKSRRRVLEDSDDQTGSHSSNSSKPVKHSENPDAKKSNRRVSSSDSDCVPSGADDDDDDQVSTDEQISSGSGTLDKPVNDESSVEENVIMNNSLNGKPNESPVSPLSNFQSDKEQPHSQKVCSDIFGNLNSSSRPYTNGIKTSVAPYKPCVNLSPDPVIPRSAQPGPSPLVSPKSEEITHVGEELNYPQAIRSADCIPGSLSASFSFLTSKTCFAGDEEDEEDVEDEAEELLSSRHRLTAPATSISKITR